MKIRNLINSYGELTAIDEFNCENEAGPVLRSFYLPPKTKPPEDIGRTKWVIERVKGNYLKCGIDKKSAEYKEIRDDLMDQGMPILEGDVGPIDRALADNRHLEIDSKFSWVAIDIETADIDRQLLTDHKNIKLISFAWHGSDGKRGFRRVAQLDSDKAERDLLFLVSAVLKQYNVAVAWNGGKEFGNEGFDFPVLRERMLLHNVKHNWYRQMCLDQLVLYKKHFLVTSDGAERQSFALNAVAKVQLNKGKVPIKKRLIEIGIDPGPAGIIAAYKYAPDLLEEYNLEDVDLQVDIEKKTQFLSLHFALCSLVNCLPRADSLTPTRIMDALMMRLGSQHGYHWKTQIWAPFDEKQNRKVDKASGASVMPVVPGLSEGVSVLDVASLYPSLIRALNLGPDTRCEDGPIKPRSTTMEGRPTGHIVASFKGHDQPGQLPRALELIIGKRKEFETKLKLHPPGTNEHEDYKRLSNACKVAANAMYGIILQNGSRYYDQAVGEAVTNTGRLCIRAVVDAIQEKGYKVILQDTDSAAFVCEPEVAPKIIDTINQQLFPDVLEQIGVPRQITTSLMQIKYEERYKYLLQVATKKYAGIFEFYRGAPAVGIAYDIKGLECVRGDTIQFARKLQRSVVDLILTGCAPAALKAHVTKLHKTFMSKEIEPSDVMIHQNIKKNIDEYKSIGPQVVAARLLVDKGISLNNNKIAYWLAFGKKVTLDIDWDQSKVDRDFYWNKKIWPATKRVLKAAFGDYDWELDAKQLSLLDIMK